MLYKMFNLLRGSGGSSLLKNNPNDVIKVISPWVWKLPKKEETTKLPRRNTNLKTWAQRLKYMGI